MIDKKCVIFCGSSRGLGLTFHFANLAKCLAEEISRHQNLDFLLLSENGEQNEGLWETVNKTLNPDEIEITDGYEQFCDVIEKKLLDPSYTKVIVLTQSLKQFSQLTKLKKTFKSKLFLYIRLNSFRHGAWYRGILTAYYARIFLKYADYVNFQCAYTADIFSFSKELFQRGIGGIIPLGLSEEPIIEPDDSALTNLFADGEISKIVYLAQFHKHKGHRALINSLANFLKERNNVRLILLGDGKLHKDIKMLVKNKGLGEKVMLPGRIDRKYVPWVLEKTDCALVLSKVETFGHNILEPLFYGTPVVSTDVGIAREVVKDFHTGFLMRGKSGDQQGRHLENILDNKAMLVDMGKNASLRVKDEYSWSSIAKRYVRLFHSIN